MGQERERHLSTGCFDDSLRALKIRGRPNHFRIRVGEYRIVYCPFEKQLLVEVIRVGHRKDVYRWL